MITHQSRNVRATLDLSYTLKLMERGIESDNDTTMKTSPQGEMDQMGHVLDLIIYTYAEARKDEVIFTAKTDVKDGFWRCITEEGQEWNFAHVLPQAEGEPIKLVIPMSLQMGWIK